MVVSGCRMPCYHPVKAWYGTKLSSGKREIVFSSGQAQSCLRLALPCGTCPGCILEHARQWAMRCMDEASLYPENSFVTLTWDPKNLVGRGRGLDKRDHQLFMKRLRKALGPDHLVRFFMCGEYGSKFGRPHFHYLLFNVGFPDKVYFKTTPSGEKIYISEFLKSVWPYGFSSVGDVTFGSAGYVARYHLKKAGSLVSKDHYVDPKTGEMLPPEFVLMSRGSSKRGTGGIAKGWYEKYKTDVYPRDCRVIRGVDTKPCKFYDKLYEAEDSSGFSSMKLDRMVNASARLADNTEERLIVKEKVKLAQLASLKSSLEE